ncbi:hypothetical protein DIZ76_016165 [Coccidioides immitis]|nr:hypothetical protein DIZ76_016165 [Coccidioides immitis]
MANQLPFPSFTRVWHNKIYPTIDPSQNPSIAATGKKVVISGGGSGIGPHIVKAFAAAGALQIVIFGRRIETLKRTQEKVKREFPGTEVDVLVADIADEPSVCKLAADIKRLYGTWDVFVSNAGYSPELLSVTDSITSEWFKAFDVNVKGNFLLVREFVPFAAATGAVFVHVSSGACHALPRPGHSAYCAAKLASTKIMEHFQRECSHIRFTSIHPGIIPTEMANTLFKVSKALPIDDASLPAAFAVWVASSEADFARGRMLWCNWDVGELKMRASEIIEKNLLVTSLEGWATYFPDPSSEVYKGILAEFLG